MCLLLYSLRLTSHSKKQIQYGILIFQDAPLALRVTMLKKLLTGIKNMTWYMKFLLFSKIVEFRTSYDSNLLYVQFKSKCIMKQQVKLFKIFFNLGFLMNSRGIEVSIRFNSLNSRSEVLRRSLIPSGITKWSL